jgi:RimJ/RimL family protein N-acetyltransferase
MMKMQPAGLPKRPLAAQQRDGFSFYVVTEKSSGNALGICGLVKQDALPLTDIGYAFLESAQGQGYAYEAAAGVMRYAQEVLQMQELMAITSPKTQRRISCCKNWDSACRRKNTRW